MLKFMKKQDLNLKKGLDIAALKKEVSDLRGKIVNLKLEKNTNKLKDKTVVSKTRRDLAQVLTILSQKEQLMVLEKGESKSS